MSSVDLDREFQLRTLEIDDVLIYSILTTEFITKHLSTREVHPEQYFGGLGVVPEKAALRFLGSDVEVKGH